MLYYMNIFKLLYFTCLQNLTATAGWKMEEKPRLVIKLALLSQSGFVVLAGVYKLGNADWRKILIHNNLNTCCVLPTR